MAARHFIQFKIADPLYVSYANLYDASCRLYKATIQYTTRKLNNKTCDKRILELDSLAFKLSAKLSELNINNGYFNTLYKKLGVFPDVIKNLEIHDRDIVIYDDAILFNFYINNNSQDPCIDQLKQMFLNVGAVLTWVDKERFDKPV